MALAEAGYPNAHVFWDDRTATVHVIELHLERPEWNVPREVIRRAFAICAPIDPRYATIVTIVTFDTDTGAVIAR
jgi:hypothetical protein